YLPTRTRWWRLIMGCPWIAVCWARSRAGPSNCKNGEMEWWSDGIGVLALVVLQYSNILILEETLTMEICFLGTGAPWPDPLRGSSAILVDVGSARILLDCGR